MREDLAPGLQMAQAGHALVQYCMEHPATARQWFDQSNNLVVLGVPGEDVLKWYAQGRGFTRSAFYEPDLGGEMTAVAFEPCEAAALLCSDLPLAGRVMV